MKTLSLQTAAAALLALLLCLPLHSRAEDAPKVDIKLIPSEADTGTMHYSNSVEVKLGPGRPAILGSSVEKGYLAPSYFFKTEITAPDSAILFGYSSWGSGTETIHVILVKRYDTNTVVTDHLRLTTRRGECGVFYTKEGWLFVAVPSEKLENEEKFLQTRSAVIRYDKLKTLKTFPVPKNAQPIPYSPIGGKPNVPPGSRTIRINIQGDRFTLAPWN